MENTPQSLDPASDLALLDRARNGLAVDDFLDFGPWWYAPLLATMAGGLTLFGRDFDDRWNVLFGAVGLAAGLTMALHDYRRRKVRPRATARAAALLGLAVLICWIIIGLWGTAVSTIGYDDFVPGYALLGWCLTTVALLAIRAGLGLLRRRRGPVA